MKHKNNKGMVLGITTVTMLVLLLIISAVFAVVTAKTKFYYNQNKMILDRVNLQVIAQEVYVNIVNDIKNNDVKDTYNVSNYGEVIITIEEDYYYYEITNTSGKKISVKLSSTGTILEWVIN